MSIKKCTQKGTVMAAKGRGGGKTPLRLVELLNKAVAKISIRSISKATGLGLAPISRYLKGTSEPSQASLEKLADFFNVTVSYLRGESNAMRVREYVDNDDIPGRVEEIDQWIEEDEERRNWSDNKKASVLCGLTLVEQVLKDDDVSQYAIEYMKRRLRLLGIREEGEINESELRLETEKAEAKAAAEGWTESELALVKSLLVKHRGMLGGELEVRTSREGIGFENPKLLLGSDIKPKN
jgi:transcriptional regulator with XRE-family HTH domain